jgi:hypothetical protein
MVEALGAGYGRGGGGAAPHRARPGVGQAAAIGIEDVDGGHGAAAGGELGGHRVADDRVGHDHGALGQLEPTDRAVTPGGQEVAGDEGQGPIVGDRLAALVLEEHLEGAAGAGRGDPQPRPREDAAARLQVVADQAADVGPGQRDLGEAVVERRRLVQRAVGQGPGRQIGAQAAAVGHRQIGARHRGPHQIGEQVALGRLGVVAAGDRRRQRDAQGPALDLGRDVEGRRDHRGDLGRRLDRAALVLADHALAGRHQRIGGVGAQVARRVDHLAGHHAARVDAQIDAAEGPTVGVGLDHRDLADAVGHRGVGVAGDDHIDRPGRQEVDHLEQLLLAIARRQVRGIMEVGALRADVGGDHDHLGAAAAQVGGLGGDRQRRLDHGEADEVGRHRRERRGLGGHADHPDHDRALLEEERAEDVVPGRPLAGRDLEDVGHEEREVGLDRAGPQRAARILAGAGGHRRADRAEVELVVADRGGVVADLIVGRDHRGALAEVRAQGALEHVAGVDHQELAAVGLSRGAQVGDVAGQDREAIEGAVEIVGADDRQGQAALADGRRRAIDGRRPAGAGDRQGQDQPEAEAGPQVTRGDRHGAIVARPHDRRAAAAVHPPGPRRGGSPVGGAASPSGPGASSSSSLAPSSSRSSPSTLSRAREAAVRAASSAGAVRAAAIAEVTASSRSSSPSGPRVTRATPPPPSAHAIGRPSSTRRRPQSTG